MATAACMAHIGANALNFHPTSKLKYDMCPLYIVFNFPEVLSGPVDNESCPIAKKIFVGG